MRRVELWDHWVSNVVSIHVLSDFVWAWLDEQSIFFIIKKEKEKEK